MATYLISAFKQNAEPPAGDKLRRDKVLVAGVVNCESAREAQNLCATMETLLPGTMFTPEVLAISESPLEFVGQRMEWLRKMLE